MNSKPEHTLELAEEFFNVASEELNRPEEDLVPYAVCRNAYLAVNNFMIGYLQQHGKEIHGTTSLEELVQQCSEFNHNFMTLDLSNMYKSSEDVDVWMDLETAKEYMDLAVQTRTFVSTVEVQ
ncbi:MAG: hypothetical protein ACPGJS_13865 [Flammeovirgaceae bacterium]